MFVLIFANKNKNSNNIGTNEMNKNLVSFNFTVGISKYNIIKKC